MTVPDWVQQAAHFGLGACGALIGIPLSIWTPLPGVACVLLAIAPGYGFWWLRELAFQWPISATSDFRWDTLWHHCGILAAGLAAGLT